MWPPPHLTGDAALARQCIAAATALSKHAVAGDAIMHRMAERNDLEFTYSLIDRVFRLSLGELADFSCAKYDGDFSLDLEAAQERKHQFVLDQLGVAPGRRLLDLGCGWGPLLDAVRRRGGTGGGVTLSSAQAPPPPGRRPRPAAGTVSTSVCSMRGSPPRRPSARSTRSRASAPSST